MTTTATSNGKATKKAARSVSLSTMTHGKLIVWITQDGETRGYVLTKINEQTYRLGKADIGGCTVEYSVCIDTRNQRHSCDCAGHNFRNKCRHVESLAALIAAGKL